MQTSSKINTAIGDLGQIAKCSLQPFSDEVISFLDDLSKAIITEKELSDVATFGFWVRRASMLKEKAKYDDMGERLGRGVAFHIAPSNVPVNFAFTLAAGLLAGNANIVRLPSNDYSQVNTIVKAINRLLHEKHKKLLPYICLVKYPRDKEISDMLSNMCDVRVVWGGDKTIAEMRLSPLKPRAKELTFADRYSVAVINADRYLEDDNKEKIALDFYNDTYFSDQNACSSPSIVFWIGEKKAEAKTLFWNHVHRLACERYTLTAVQAVGKLAALHKAAANIACEPIEYMDNYVARVKIENISENILEYKHHSGFFFEHDINSLCEILPVCASKLQTITYYGLEHDEMQEFIIQYKPQGIDRIVPFGKSMDFALIWDGYDLIREMSRRIVLA